MEEKCKIFFAIETSCDDTCVGVIKTTHNKDSFSVCWNVLANIKVTQKYANGVLPEVAARLHLKEIKECCDRALLQANLTMEDVDVVCATATPGLVGSLFVGYNFALSLAIANRKTFIPIHHLEGHMLVCFDEIKFNPFIAVIVSGGHSQIVICKEFGKYNVVCTTVDDSAGEALDKVGRALGCSFPAGPEVEKLAENSVDCTLDITLPCRNQMMWSFSGTKAACLRFVEAGHKKEDIAFALQKVICDSIFEKLQMVLSEYKMDNIIFCGGVSANKYLRSRLSSFNVKYANIEYCTDNGVMIAVAGANHYFNHSNKVNNYFETGRYVDLDDWHLV